jgi:pimeloyl-ACP methyl ester carboxylesterase
VDLAAYNTVESADDLEAIRAALGAERINLWGHSYGSHLALAYVRRHGEHVQRLIVGGVNGPGQRWRYPGDGQALLERVDSAVRAHPRLSPLVPDLVGTTRRVLARLDAEPARVRGGGAQAAPAAHGDDVHHAPVVRGLAAAAAAHPGRGARRAAG